MIKKEVVIGDCRLLLGDSTVIVPTLEPVDAVITSPPYGQQRDYGRKIDDWRSVVSGAIALAPDDNSPQVLVNLGLIHKDGEVVPYWDPFIDDMRAHGWRLFGWYVWDKLDGMAGDWNGRLAPAHEWIFHFNKSSRQANKFVPCKMAGHLQKGNPGIRKPDGTQTGFSHAGRPVQATKIADSVIRVVPQRGGDDLVKQHPAVYPIEIPTTLIQSYTDVGDVVLDPFLGSGTTLVACAKLGRRGIGIEIDADYFDIACERIRKAYAQPDMFIETARVPEPTQEAML